MAAADMIEEGGEGYFASISDLMVGILFVFLLMLTVLALNFRDAEDDQNVKRAELERALAQAESARREAERQRVAAETQKQANENLRKLLREAASRLKDELDARQRARTELLNTLKERLSKAGLTVEIQPDTGVLRLPEQLLFEKGESELGRGAGGRVDAVRLTEARDKLGRLGSALAEVLPCFGTGVGDTCAEKDRATLEGVLVEGHSDRLGWGGQSDEVSRDRNDRLSVERALAVFKEIRLRNKLDEIVNRDGLPMLAVSAYGDRRPVVRAGTTGDELRPNRRIDLRFLLSSRTSEDLQRLLARIEPAIAETNP